MARPPKFVPEVQSRILLALKAGVGPTVAAASAGVGASTFFHWMADTRRPYRDFRDACQVAIAESEIRMVGSIMLGLQQSPGAAMKLLERRFPERWGRRRAELESVPPELGGDEKQPPSGEPDRNVVMLPPEWANLWATMYLAAQRGESPDDFLTRPDVLASLRDSGDGFGPSSKES